MKTPLVNLEELKLAQYREQKTYINKLLRYWGTTTINGVEVFRPKSYYYRGDWTHYNDILNSIVPGYEPDVSTRLPPRDSKERKLLEFLDLWKDVKNQEFKGVRSAWLEFDPGVAIERGIAGTVLAKDLKETVSHIEDKDGYSTFTVTLLGNNNWIPSDVMYSSSDRRDWTFNYAPSRLGESIQIPLYRDYEVIEAVRTVRDENGDPVVDSEGEVLTTPVKLKSYVNAFNYLISNKEDVWKYHGLLSNTSAYDFPGTEEEQTAYENYLDVLSSTALLRADPSTVRISNIKRSFIKIAPTTQPGNILTESSNLPSGEYSYTSGLRNATQKYNIPAYTITYVVKDIDVSEDSAITQQLISDGQDRYYTTRSENANEDYISYTGYGINNKKLRTWKYRDKVNSYLNNEALENANKYAEENASYLSSLHGQIYDDFDLSSLPDSMWVKDGRKFYLRKDFLTTDAVFKDRGERIELLLEMIKGDYRKRKSSFLRRLITIIVAIVITVVAVILTGGIGTGFISVITSLAFAVTTFSLALSLMSLVWEHTGNYAAAAWSSRFNKSIAPLVTVASIILAFTSIINTIKNAASSLTSAVASGASTAVQFAKDILSWAVQKIKNISFNQALNLFSKAFEFFSQRDLKKLNNELAEKQKELEEYQEAQEDQKYTDIVRSMMHSLANPLEMLDSHYQFDRPYEPIYGEYHSGNSCRTTKIALYGEGAKTYVSNIV